MSKDSFTEHLTITPNFGPDKGMAKISVNMNPATLAAIDLLVEQGHYSNRSDFINHAVRDAIQLHQPIIDMVAATQRSMKGRQWFLGLFGITAAEILDANPQLEEDDRLLPDQVLLIPIRGELREDNVGGSIEYPVIYEAREGDSLASVAERFGVSVEGLRYANIAMMDGDDLVKGQNLIVIPENYGDRLI